MELALPGAIDLRGEILSTQLLFKIEYTIVFNVYVQELL